MPLLLVSMGAVAMAGGPPPESQGDGGTVLNVAPAAGGAGGAAAFQVPGPACGVGPGSGKLGPAPHGLLSFPCKYSV